MTQPKTCLVPAADAERGLRPFSHPWNRESQVDFFQLGPATGLLRTGVNLGSAVRHPARPHRFPSWPGALRAPSTRRCRLLGSALG
jgi:hypothetical protein